MAHIVVLGAGLGGGIKAYELRDQVRPEDRITVITKDAKYHFVPSNPWIAVGWRKREDITVDLAPAMAKRNIDFKTVAAARLHPAENRVELVDGTSVSYDHIVIATGPELAFDEIEGFGPAGHTQSVCHVDHALQAHDRFQEFCKNTGPIIVGAAQGASCFGPAYEFLFILETELRRRKIRDKVPMTLHVAGLHQTELPEMHRLALRFLADVNALGAVRGKCTAQIDDAIPRVAAGHVGENIAQGFTINGKAPKAEIGIVPAGASPFGSAVGSSGGDVSAALQAAAARGDWSAIQNHYQQGGGTWLGKTAAESGFGFPRSSGGIAGLADPSVEREAERQRSDLHVGDAEADSERTVEC